MQCTQSSVSLSSLHPPDGEASQLQDFRGDRSWVLGLNQSYEACPLWARCHPQVGMGSWGQN